MADENVFAVELVTPERILVTGSAIEVILRTREGELSFLAGHTSLVGTIEPGVVQVLRADGDDVRAAVHGGFVQVEHGVPVPDDAGGTAGAVAGGTRVTMLVGVAELATEIDAERARTALEGAQARLSELGAAGGRGGSGPGEPDEPDADLVEAEAALRRAEVRLEATEATAGSTA